MDNDEVALASAITAGDVEAIRTFELRYLTPLRSTLRGMGMHDADIADIEQTMRVRFLVCEPGGRSRLEDYAGLGKLAGLVRIAAVREALGLLRRRRPPSSDDWLDDLSSPEDDPSLAQLKARHWTAFKEAFKEAVRRLPARDHSLLRLSLLHGRSIDQIGATYGVHRATAARWVDAAKRQLRTSTNDVLAERFDLRGPELAQVVELIESRIELSIDRLLATAARPPDGTG